MIDAKEAAGALYGIWRIVGCDEKASEYFNGTVEGFWRSFVAAAVLAPLQALYQLAVYLKVEQPPPLFRIGAIESLEYVILWVLFPLVMLYVSRLLDVEERFLPYAVAHNWLQLGVGLVFMPWVILAAFDLLSPGFSNFISALSLVAYTFYAAFIARTILGVAMGTAIGVVLLDLILTLIVGRTTFGMLQGVG